ncbi:hypothetical protein AGABI1DRAFT_64155 [Agaricus bisporus var. burnettii JB137-S8]|uniref:CID domain-containing protein n=1 Tax=Agaricus bisporus var. burnettii (strain JB137-S8 / ATCC MYA-4627 / FGSC 10392) TaxID=597362 RepID=K5WY59_AGABU|nr:uncharacterized protein AGABI1DRAFT_64155 [Agaricus bisporus var. burnettii JB137-S8]EKM75758.1 hypothetical protein AGABI1DRAFT_64155 [Agaricus bisporus var. burnettii JB137-S8]
MDPFEVRMQFISMLRRLTASQQSVQKVVGYCVKFAQCGEDLWDCIIEECRKGSINSRINILHFLDSLCETSLLLKSRSAPSTSQKEDVTSKGVFVDYLARDLSKIISYVVPEGRQGLPNLSSTKQILENWRIKRVIDPQKVDDVLSDLNNRPATAPDTSGSAPQPTTTHEPLSRNEIFKRVEEDRERHKRLRERRWVQSITHDTTDHRSLTLACFLPLAESAAGERALGIDIEFENEWETASDWNEDDDDAAAEESELCFRAEGEGPMDLS